MLETSPTETLYSGQLTLSSQGFSSYERGWPGWPGFRDLGTSLIYLKSLDVFIWAGCLDRFPISIFTERDLGNRAGNLYHMYTRLPGWNFFQLRMSPIRPRAECGLRQRGQKWRQVSRFLHTPPTLQTVVPLPQQGGTDGIMVLCLLYFPQHKYPI